MSFTPIWKPPARKTFDDLRNAAKAAAKSRGNGGKASKQEGLFKQVRKCVNLLLSNPKHPGLQSHVFHSLPHPFTPGGKVFEVYVQNRTPGAYRLFWCYGPGGTEITIIAITPHP